VAAGGVRTVPGDTLRPRDGRAVGPPGTLPRDRVSAANRPTIVERKLWWHNAFWRIPNARARARTALVVATPRTGPCPVKPNGRPARLDLLWSGGTLYEVDLGLYHTSVTFELPSRDDLLPFIAVVEIEWRVADAAHVVRDNLHDLREAFVPALRRRLRGITRRYPTVELHHAEVAVCDELDGWDPGADYGLRTSIVLRLTADDLAVKHAAARRRIEHRTEIENMEHDLKKLTDGHDQERRQTRLTIYRAIIKAGNVDQFALQLASNPDDVRAVMHLAREERNEDRRQLTDFLTKLLGSGAIDRWDVEDQVREALSWLAESTQRAVQTGENQERWRHAGNGRSYVP